MKEKITRETVEYVATLAQLSLDTDESLTALRDMEQMLEMFHKLDEVDTSGVEPLSYIQEISNVFREDEGASACSPDTLANAPQKEKNMFVVPRTFA